MLCLRLAQTEGHFVEQHNDVTYKLREAKYERTTHQGHSQNDPTKDLHLHRSYI